MSGVIHSQKSNMRKLFSSFSHTAPIQEIEQPGSKRKAQSKRATKKPQVQQPKPPQAPKAKPYKKKKIPTALREATWIKTMGRKFEGKCPVVWCSNTITAFDFQAGHNVPESKGGSTTLPNLIAICARCNFSMGNQYTIDEWNVIHAPGTQPVLDEQKSPVEIKDPPKKVSFWRRICCCFFR